MVIYFRFDHTKLGNNIDLGWLLATRTKQRWMTCLVTFLVTFMLRVTVTVTTLLPSLEIIVRFWLVALVATTLSLGSVEPSFSSGFEQIDFVETRGTWQFRNEGSINSREAKIPRCKRSYKAIHWFL